MLTSSDVERLEELKGLDEGTLAASADVLWLVGRLRDLNNELVVAHRHNALLRAYLREII